MNQQGTLVGIRLGFAAAIFLIAGAASAGPELVSSDNTNLPLAGTGFIPLGMGESGRYALFNDPETCTIYRKDRATGDLLAVLESDENYRWCDGAAISDDGNLVAASPWQQLPGGCDDVRDDENGVPGCFLGVLTELVVKNITTGDTTKVKRDLISATSRVINGSEFPYGVHLEEFAGNGGHAIVSRVGVVGAATMSLYRLLDITTGSSVPLEPPVAEDETLQIMQVSISDDGNRLALLAGIASPPNPPAGKDCSITDPRLPGPITGPIGEPGDDSWWQWGYDPECQPVIEGPDVFIWDRAQEILTNLGGTAVPGSLGAVTQPVIAGNGNHAAWLDTPQLCSQLDANSDLGGFILVPCNGNEEPCTEGACDTQIMLATLSSGEITQITAPDADTNVCRQRFVQVFGFGQPAVPVAQPCDIGIADNGSRVLFAREIDRPCGGDWSPNDPVTSTADMFFCFERGPWESGGEVVTTECPGGDWNFPPGPGIPGGGLPTPGPLCYEFGNPEPVQCSSDPDGQLGNFFGGSTTTASGPATIGPEAGGQVLGAYTPIYLDSHLVGAYYSAPLTWHVADTVTGHTTLVSVDDQGRLFNAGAAKLAGNGAAWEFYSQDPRLQNDNPATLAAEEAALDEACFWSPAGTGSNLRVGTNDTTSLGRGSDDLIVYPATPVFCPVSDPALTRHVFAADLTDAVDAAAITFRNWWQGRGAMNTWYGNFSADTATLAALTIDVSGLGPDGVVDVAGPPDCDVYYPLAGAVDDTINVRCEFSALQPWQMQQLQWSFSGPDSGLITVTTAIETNERDIRLRNNLAKTKVFYFRQRARRWLRSWF
jgi:hypothetical protein